MREAITLAFLFLVFMVAWYGLGFATLNSPRITDQIETSPNPGLRAIDFLEKTYLFLFLPAVAEVLFIIFWCFELVMPWSKTVISNCHVLIIYGILFLAFAAYGTMAATSAHEAAVRSIGYSVADEQLRNLLGKIYDTAEIGLTFWIFASALFVILPPVKRALK